MSLAPVILPFTHWPVAYTDNAADTPPELPTPPEKTAEAHELIAAASRMPSDIVLTCATGFSRGVVIGLASGAIEILTWDDTENESDAIGLTSLSTTAGHRKSPVVALRRIAAKDTEGRSELLVSAAENGEILKHSLPSGRVLKSTAVPFRPNGIISVDTYLIIYGRSTELRILHQNTLEPHIILAGMLRSWPIPMPLFGDRIVTLDSTGEGQHWKIWPDEARMERITSFGAPMSFFHHANAQFQISEKSKTRAKSSRKSRMSKDATKIKLADPSFGAVIAVHTVGEILWLVVQVNGWCLYKWEEDTFSEVKRQEMKRIAGATSSDAVEDRHRNWFGVWTYSGEIVFATVDTAKGTFACNIKSIAPSQKPQGVQTISIVLSFTQNHAPRRAIIVTPWVVEPKDILVEFFYLNGEIRYYIFNLHTYEWDKESYPIHRLHHFFNKVHPQKSFAPSSPPTEFKSSVPPTQIAIPAPMSPLTAALANCSQRGVTAGPCATGTVFANMLAFGCGLFVNIYTVPRYLLAFESPNHSIKIEETGSKVSQLSAVKTTDGMEYLLIGTTAGALYVLKSKDFTLSRRIALFGSPVLHCMALRFTSNPLICDLVVVASRDGTVCLVNLHDAKKVFTIPGHFSEIRLLATPTDSNILIVLYEDQCGRLCNLRNGKIENQNEISFGNEEDWEISYIKVRPTIPDNKMVYTDSRYTINGSSTIFINLHLLLSQIVDRDKPDVDALANAKAILSALYSWQAFESVDFPDSKKIVDMLFYKYGPILDGDTSPSTFASVPAKLGARGIANTLTVFHAHQDLLQISGEITSMVMLVCTVLAQVLLHAQLPPTPSSEGAEKSTVSLADIYYDQFVSVLFAVTESVEGKAYKRPWLRGFARFWSAENEQIRLAARRCLKARIDQLGRRPRELSLTISRWRVLLPGVVAQSTGRKSFMSKRRASAATEDGRGLDRIVTADGEEFIGHDEVFDDLSEAVPSMKGDDACDRTMDESFGLACAILGSIGIEFAEAVSHVAQREIASAIELQLARSDGLSLSDDSSSTIELQNIAIELVGLGWHVWGDDKYFSSDTVIRRLIEFLGADPTPMVVGTKTALDVETTFLDKRRHELLQSAVIAIAKGSINMVVEICSSTIGTAVDPQVRIGAVKFMYHVVLTLPDVMIDRLFPLVDATISTLDPSSSGMRNKVVNSITALFNALVNTYSVVASHRAQQRLALSIRPDLVLVYDLRTGTQMACLEGAKNQCLEIQFSPEGRHVLGIDRVTGELYVWKLGHSFLSMIQSIGGTNHASMANSGSGSRYAAHFNGAVSDAASRDLVYPRYVSKLRDPCQLLDLKKLNSSISISWKQEKVLEVTVKGVLQVFNFSHT
ncbi:hypothetical protein V1512DRAFT_265890 [Lipomyces arxii]|uniref:uncharacterized protein n=1 Tax=Lipomyces arxii TaxID=56418 RepID=UPI0034CE30F0